MTDEQPDREILAMQQEILDVFERHGYSKQATAGALFALAACLLRESYTGEPGQMRLAFKALCSKMISDVANRKDLSH